MSLDFLTSWYLEFLILEWTILEWTITDSPFNSQSHFDKAIHLVKSSPLSAEKYRFADLSTY